jgi:hypothetical protein
MLIALIITSLLLIGSIAVSIWLGRQVRQARAERDKHYLEHQIYRKQMRPVIRYLARRHQEGRDITDDGLRTTFAMLHIDYEQWIEDVSQ